MSYFYGDSIAVGFGQESPGRRAVGASPSQVLKYLQEDLQKNPNIFSGKNINLSSGISNNRTDFYSIQKQLELLKNSGANVDLIGASNQRYPEENKKLASLANQFGFNFLGGFNAGSDMVHPASYDYSVYSGNRVNTPNTLTVSPSDTVNPVNIVLAKLKGTEGLLDKTQNKFTEQAWTPTEAERYTKYLNAKNAAEAYQSN